MNIGRGTFHNANCLDVLRAMPSASVDLTVTSPPYDNLRDYGKDEGWTFDKFKPIAAQIHRVTMPGGIVVWNVQDATVSGSKTGSSFRQALFFQECGFNIHDTMIWNKGGFTAVGALTTRYAPVFEYMFVFSKGKPKTFNPIKDRPNKHAGATIHGTMRQKNATTRAASNIGKIIAPFGQRFNIWEIGPQRQRGDDCHPAPFPVQIPQDHILSWTNPGDMVFDPFGGSASTALAAENTDRRWALCEINKGYFDSAADRVRRHVGDGVPDFMGFSAPVDVDFLSL